MNKYIFPIIKWKIKPWLKYYILNKRLAPSYPLSEIIEGTSPLTLENSVRKKFNIFNVGGNTKQATLPNPDFPIEVENVSGDVNVKVENKNLAVKNLGNNVATFDNYQGPLTIAIKPATGASQLNCRLHFQDGTTSNKGLVGTNSNNGQWYRASLNLSKPITAIDIYNTYSATARTIDKLMIAKSNYSTFTDADYEPHEEQTATLSLPEGMEMCKIGDYKDSFVYQDGKWYKNKVIEKLVLNGSEDWSTKSTSNSKRRITLPVTLTAASDSTLNVICNQLLYKTSSEIYLENEGISISSEISLYVPEYSTETIPTSWKTHLSSSNLIVYYALATSVQGEITDTTLISQLDNLASLYSYKGTTYISSSNTPSPVFEVQYYMEGGDV